MGLSTLILTYVSGPLLTRLVKSSFWSCANELPMRNARNQEFEVNSPCKTMLCMRSSICWVPHTKLLWRTQSKFDPRSAPLSVIGKDLDRCRYDATDSTGRLISIEVQYRGDSAAACHCRQTFNKSVKSALPDLNRISKIRSSMSVGSPWMGDLSCAFEF
jgi:hypothetical protein